MRINHYDPFFTEKLNILSLEMIAFTLRKNGKRQRKTKYRIKP